MPLEAGGLGAGRYVPQPDRVVVRARGEPPVRQQAEGVDRRRMPFEAGGLGAGRHVPQTDRVVAESPRRAARPAAGRGRRTAFVCPSRRAVSAPVATSHRRIVLSPEPEASRPSGSRQRAITSLVCPSRRAVSAPVATSHRRIVLSKEPEASRPSGSRQRRSNRSRMPFEAGGLGACRHIPQTDCRCRQSLRRAARPAAGRGRLPHRSALRGGRSRRRAAIRPGRRGTIAGPVTSARAASTKVGKGAASNGARRPINCGSSCDKSRAQMPVISRNVRPMRLCASPAPYC